MNSCCMPASLSSPGILKLGHNAHPPTAAHAAEDRALSKSGLSRKEDVCLPAVCHHTCAATKCCAPKSHVWGRRSAARSAAQSGSDAAAEPSDASSAASVFFCSPVSHRASAGESGSRPRTSKPISSVGAAWRGRMRRDYNLGRAELRIGAGSQLPLSSVRSGGPEWGAPRSAHSRSPHSRSAGRPFCLWWSCGREIALPRPECCTLPTGGAASSNMVFGPS